MNSGSRAAVFGIAFVQMLITVLTLGVGRFWMITRLRQFHWSAFSIDDDPFEYTGKAIELLIGFLIALVILAAYLMVVNLSLAFVGFSYFDGNPVALQLSVLTLIPIGFWAQYRARRYILSRTRWRGVRFGVEPAAWAYMWRALGLSALTLLTLGLAYPYQQMTLARFTTNRTYFGSLGFEQQGSVGPLFRSWLLVITPLIIVFSFAIAQWAQIAAEVDTVDILDGEGELSLDFGDGAPVTGGLVIFAIFAALWAYVLWLRHSVFSFRYLNSNKVLASATTFDLRLGFWAVVGVYVMGGIIIAILSSIIMTVFSTLLGMIVYAGGVDPEQLQKLAEGEFLFADMSILIALAVAYLFAIVAIISLSQAFITLPMMRMIARTTEVYGIEEVARAQQRARDEQVEAGGFADALGADVGGAF